MKTQHRSRRHYLCVSLAGFALLIRPSLCNAADTSIPTASSTAGGPHFARWGSESLKFIRERFWSPQHQLYTEYAFLSDGRHWRGSHPSFMSGVRLSLLNAAAARLEPKKYLLQAVEYADAIEVYWLSGNGIEGFNVQPGPKDSDRYYDDSAWLLLALTELFEINNEERHLNRAFATFDFVMSGKDEILGGRVELARIGKNV